MSGIGPAGNSNGAPNIDGQPPRPSASNTKKFACVLCRRRKLKCDGARPACCTCSRLKHQCAYQDEAPRKPGTKRRNIKELEARLAQVETKITQGTENDQTNASGDAIAAHRANLDDQWNDIDMNIDWNGLDNPTDSLSPPDPVLGDASASWMLPLGLLEALPPQSVIDALNQTFFDKINPGIPMINRQRFLTACASAPHMRPVVCLRYIMWALAAFANDEYAKYRDVFYQRARMYAELDELKGLGEQFITIQHAQCWILISSYEIRDTAFPRAWMSSGKASRLSQMMGLHRLDWAGREVKQTVPPASNWTEQEERRRTFWGAFASDRWASAGTGWPMTFHEEDIITNLPASEEAYMFGIPEKTPSLTAIGTAEGIRQLSPFAGVVVMAALFGHNIIHLHRPHVKDHPYDLQGEFWKRHRKMDNILSTISMSLPRHMRFPLGVRDPNVVLVNVNLHSSTICLHQAAILKVEEHHLDPHIRERSQARCNVAAAEIANIMRLTCHMNFNEMNPWVCFSLYVAAQVFIDGCKRNKDNLEEHRSNLDFVVDTLHSVGEKHKIVGAFITQIHHDMETIGLVMSPANDSSSSDQSLDRSNVTRLPHRPGSDQGQSPASSEDQYLNKTVPVTGGTVPFQTPLFDGVIPRRHSAASPCESSLSGTASSETTPLACAPMGGMWARRPAQESPEQMHSQPKSASGNEAPQPQTGPNVRRPNTAMFDSNAVLAHGRMNNEPSSGHNTTHASYGVAPTQAELGSNFMSADYGLAPGMQAYQDFGVSQGNFMDPNGFTGFSIPAPQGEDAFAGLLDEAGEQLRRAR